MEISMNEWNKHNQITKEQTGGKENWNNKSLDLVLYFYLFTFILFIYLFFYSHITLIIFAGLGFHNFVKNKSSY